MNMKKVLALTLSVTMALSVTGCTSAENSSSTESKTEQSESTGLSLSGKTFHVGGQLRQTSLYLYYARDMGLFEKAGLDIEIETFSSGMTINEALTAGELDMAANGMASVYILPTEMFAYVGDATINQGGQEMYCRSDSDTARAGQFEDTPYIGSPSSVWAETHRSIMRLVMRKRLG